MYLSKLRLSSIRHRQP